MIDGPYVHQHFPRMMYHATKGTMIVSDPADQDARASQADGWGSTPDEAAALAPPPEPEVSAAAEEIVSEAKKMFAQAQNAAEKMIADARVEAARVLDEAKALAAKAAEPEKAADPAKSKK